ncbi:MAG: hypothetical protein ACC628_14140 [Pirellulaceae bacterium]
MRSAIRQLPLLRIFAVLVLMTATGCAGPPSWPDPFASLSRQRPAPQELAAVSQSAGDASDYASVSRQQRPANSPRRNASSRTGSG